MMTSKLSDSRVSLGRVTAPSGTLMVIDMGLLNFWLHDNPPGVPEGVLPADATFSANNGEDYRIEGKDANEAGLAFARHWHPGYVYDVPRHGVSGIKEKFEACMQKYKLDAQLVSARPRITHLERVSQAVEHGKGAGEVFFNGATAIAISGFPTSGEFEVVGDLMEDEEFSEFWSSVTIEIDTNKKIEKSEKIGVVAVDWARLIAIDLNSLGKWEHEKPLDEKADFVFWGRDAEKVANHFKAPKIEDTIYGWEGLSIKEVMAVGESVEDYRDQQGLKVATDFRPHSHHFLMMRQLRTSDFESGVLQVGDGTVCAFMTSWGDGFYPVYRETDKEGNLVTVRIELGTEESIEALRSVQGDCETC